MAPSAAANRRANIWTARIIPILLIAIIAYVSWVVTKVVCLDYLLNPSPSLHLPRRRGIAIAILTIYYVLLTMLLVCYGRLIHTVLAHPGVVPHGPQWYIENEHKRKSKERPTSEKEVNLETDSSEGYSARGAYADAESYRVQDFWMKDAFVCQHDGRPKFCSTCYNYKLDRVHHCSELNRCVYKMDHFCPWVAGIVSETSFKYFIQFTSWTAVFCLFNLVHGAYFFAERQRHTSAVDVHWILLVAFAGLFLLFGTGMSISSLQFAFENTTTIENINKRSQVYFLAIYVSEITFSKMDQDQRDSIRWISYPRPAEEQLQVLQNAGANHPEATINVTPPPPVHIPSLTTHSPAPPPSAQQPSPPPTTRMFAILETEPGANPFDLGAVNNFKEVMGKNIFDWILPLKPSPCAQRRSPYSMYKMGRVVYKMKKHAGILEEDDRARYRAFRSRTSKQRKRSQRRESHSTTERRPNSSRVSTT
jgi:palmitoyltransferase